MHAGCNLAGEQSRKEALELLGLENNASFDAIVNSKNLLLEEHGGDVSKKAEVEAAYDTLLMQSLNLRRDGKV